MVAVASTHVSLAVRKSDVFERSFAGIYNALMISLANVKYTSYLIEYLTCHTSPALGTKPLSGVIVTPRRHEMAINYGFSPVAPFELQIVDGFRTVDVPQWEVCHDPRYGRKEPGVICCYSGGWWWGVHEKSSLGR